MHSMLHLPFLLTCKLAFMSLKQALMLNDEYVLLFLHIRMMGKVMVILVHFLFFAHVYNVLITLMFDPRFKILDIVKVLVGRPKLATMVFEYNNTLLPPLDNCLSFFES